MAQYKMKYTDTQLSDLAEMAIHAIENEQNIYHPIAIAAVDHLAFGFRLTKEQIISKIRELIKD